MKKILIVNNNLHIGGIQKALVNLLAEISGKFRVDLMLFCNIGELQKEIPEDVRVFEGGARILGLTQAEAKQRGLVTYFRRSFWALATRLFTTKFTFGVLSKRYMLEKEYDCAISFMQNCEEHMLYGGCAEFVLNSVKSPKKICFVHCDFLNYGGNCEYNRKILSKFDKVAAVSRSVTSKLAAAVPEICERLYCVYNCFNFEKIKSMAEEYTAEYTKGAVNLFTAARISHEKGILRMIPIFKQLKDKGLRFVWRIAGDGPERAEAEKLIEEYGLSDEIVLLGQLENPYPFFERSDIVLVPSYNEAAPMVFTEARVFGTPVFTTDTLSARELVESEGNGWVCANDDEEIAVCLEKVMRSFSPHKNKIEKLDNADAVWLFNSLVNS